MCMVSPVWLNAQNLTLSNQAEVSILTCGPGEELDALFGHNALRIKDPIWGLDNVYDYGGFDFDTPNFYTKFTLGKLLYEVNSREFSHFMRAYEYYERWVYEQVLDIDSVEKQEIFDFVQWNIKPENKKYKYDFFFDNCATKLPVIIKEFLGDKVSFENYLTVTSSFRDLLRKETTSMPWISMGMDIALGTPVDSAASLEEHTFLPDYVLSTLENAYITENGVKRPLVKSARMLYDSNKAEPKAGILNPILVFSLLALVVLGMTLRDIKRNGRSRIMDFIILFLTGFLGLAVVFLWFGSEHAGMAKNLNVLWAFLPNIYVAFLVVRKDPPRWVRGYVRFLFILLIMMLLVWGFGIQIYATAFIPIMILLGARYIFLWQRGLA